MITKRVLNNNAVLAESTNKGSLLVFGKGIGFGKSTGDEVNTSLIEKTFLIKNEETSTRFEELLAHVPSDYVLVTEKIINYSKLRLGKALNELIFVNLTDHIYNLVKQEKNGIRIKNPLRIEIQRFYKDEYAVGLKAVEIINNEFGTNVGSDEAATIATHIVNSEIDNTFTEAYEIAQITKTVEQIVKDYYRTEFDENDLDYFRFITHIKFFAQRVMSKYHYEDDDNYLLSILKERYQDEYLCAIKIMNKISDTYSYEANSTEIVYLTTHIRRITKKLK